MTFNSREVSTFDGEPFELYTWIMGASRWYQTSGDTPRVFQGRTFDPEVLARTEVDQNGEANSGNVTVTMETGNPIAQLFLESPPSSPISLIIQCGHEGEPDVACAFTGRVSSTKFKEACELTCVSRQTIWKQSIPGLAFQSQCPLRWGSDRCGVNRYAYRVEATLSSVSGLNLVSPAFAAHPNGHFRGGWVEAEGATRMITAHTGDTITLFTPMAISVGAIVAVFPGCMGTEEDCATRYNNLANHLGCKRIPGKNPFGETGIL